MIKNKTIIWTGFLFGIVLMILGIYNLVDSNSDIGLWVTIVGGVIAIVFLLLDGSEKKSLDYLQEDILEYDKGEISEEMKYDDGWKLG